MQKHKVDSNTQGTPLFRYERLLTYWSEFTSSKLGESDTILKSLS